jgi:hypothetical protein
MRAHVVGSGRHVRGGGLYFFVTLFPFFTHSRIEVRCLTTGSKRCRRWHVLSILILYLPYNQSIGCSLASDIMSVFMPVQVPASLALAKHRLEIKSCARRHFDDEAFDIHISCNICAQIYYQ